MQSCACNAHVLADMKKDITKNCFEVFVFRGAKHLTSGSGNGGKRIRGHKRKGKKRPTSLCHGFMAPQNVSFLIQKICLL